MRRDMDLVRAILVAAADSPAPLSAQALATSRWPFQLVAYHIDIMQQAGLLSATLQRAFGGDYVVARVNSLTWEGQDLLSSIADEGVWAQTKLKVSKSATDVSVATLKAVAVKIAADMIV